MKQSASFSECLRTPTKRKRIGVIIGGHPPHPSGSNHHWSRSACTVRQVKACGSRRDNSFMCVAPQRRLQIHAQPQPMNLTQRSALNEVAPFSDRLAFVGRRFFRRRGSCPLYLAPSRAQTCRTRLFASWAIYCRLFRTSYYSPADVNDINECVSPLSSKNDDHSPFLFCPSASALDYACKPGREPLKEIQFSSGLFP
jgi:hypothetical protein